MVVGGLAARAHGATRPLADIDLYVPTGALATIANLVEPYVTRQPSRHVGDQWDIEFMQLEYAGQKIELGGADEVRIAPPDSHDWIPQHVDVGSAVRMETGLGISMPVMSRDDLVAYKRVLDRDVDRTDVASLESRAVG